MRVWPTLDGHVALSLARPSDIDLVPALVEAAASTSPWADVSSWLASVTAEEAEDRIRLLGLPGGAITRPRETPPAWPTHPRPALDPGKKVIDLSGLWAGPLCTHLLQTLGAEVVKVETPMRPDGARRGSTDFFALLNDGKEQTMLTLPRETPRLLALMRDADLVVESSRPRALQHFGIVAEDIVAGGTSWLSITARGRGSDSVGFGDDIAAAAGFVLPDADGLIPVGDAMADPLAGVAAALQAVDALASTEARLIDLSMLDVAHSAAAGQSTEHAVTRVAGAWYVECDAGSAVVEPPKRRS